MSAHPERCRGCRGSGYRPGPTLTQTVEGRPHLYTTVKPCDHQWFHDDTGWDPYHDEHLAREHQRATEAFNQGYVRGKAELAQMQPPKPSSEEGL